MAKLPKFKTDEEFAEFVETHDMTGYLDEMEVVELEQDTVYLKLELPSFLFENLKKIAASRGKSVNQLVINWLQNKVTQEYAPQRSPKLL